MPFIFQRLAGKTIIPEKLNGQILDISSNGLLPEFHQIMDTFSDIKFTFTLSIMGEQTSDIYAKILRIEECEGQYRASIEFTSIHPDAKVAIKTFIDRIIQGI